MTATAATAPATFDQHGTRVLGAPEVGLPGADPLRQPGGGDRGRRLRVLALGRSPDPDRPLWTVEPAALVVLRQRLRPDAAPTLAYLAGQGVAVKVLSGDNPISVGAIAATLGLPGATD